jgi:hypothetical protein
LRGAEDSSVLIGVRQAVGNALELLFWERRHEGTYRRRSGGGKAEAYSRCLVARVHTDGNVGFLGKAHNVMVLHVHNHLANNKWPKRLEAFWPWLWDKLVKFDVRVLMGDFNMALFRVIPELRSRGATVDLGAWFPWKSLAGTVMSDSCGIFFLDLPGEYVLHKGLGDLHADGPGGILARANPAVAGSPEDEHGFVHCGVNGGPGQPIATYLNKKENRLDNKLAPTLTPSEASRAAVAAKGKGAGKGEEKGGKEQVQRTCIKIREKRLSADLWRCEGQEYKGSHFPICVFTNNIGRRSPEKLAARAKRSAALKAQSTSRSRGDVGGDAGPARGSAWRQMWVAGGWNDGSGSGSWEQRVWVPPHASSSSSTGGNQADMMRDWSQNPGDRQDWNVWQDWRG